MKTIYKYAIPIADRFTIDMPKGARVLSVQMQRDEPQVWALVDPRAPVEPVQFRLAGTGHPIDNAAALDFVGTIQLHGGSLVFHLFRIAP